MANFNYIMLSCDDQKLWEKLKKMKSLNLKTMKPTG
jgi:hypothetical protein